MKIKYNQITLIIIVISISTAVANYIFAKVKQKCFTCVCKSAKGSTHITEPNCNFDSILTNKSIDDLPENVKATCTQNCNKDNQQYLNHFIWSE